MKFSDQQANALQDILTWRRDTRHFRTDPPPEGVLDELRAAMELAPSVGNARPWRVVRVQSPDRRAAIRAEFLRCNQNAADGYADEATRSEYLALKLAGLDNAPEQLAIFTKCDPAEGRGLGRRTMPETLQQSTSMAIFAMWLTARSKNVGMGMLSILDPDRVTDILDVPKDWLFTAYLCVGLTEFDDDTPLLHRAGWQENTSAEWEIR